MFLISEGSDIHDLGAAIVNIYHPLSQQLFIAVELTIAMLDRRLYLGICLTCTRLDMYEGAVSCGALKVIRMTFCR